jgi:membrane protein
MKLDVRGIWGPLRAAARDFGDDECPRQAAALAYYTVFALPPLLILILMLVGSLVSRETVQEALSGQFGRMLGPDGARTVSTLISQAREPGGGILPSLLGLGAVVLGATGAFLNLQSALNRAWEVRPDPRAGGVRNFILKRVLSLGMVLGIAFLLLVSLALSAALAALGGAVGALVPGGSALVVAVVQTLVSRAVITLLFATIFKVLPDAEIAWRDVWVGALFTAVLFEAGKWAIGLYLGHSNPGKAYGAAGSMAVILVWIYYSSMIVIFGAEFTQAWAVERGGGIQPSPGAVRADDVDEDLQKAATRSDLPESGSRQERPATPAEISARSRAAGAGDVDPPPSPRNERGLPGGGVGRREQVGGSGVWPASADGAPADAPRRGQAAWTGRHRHDGGGAAGDENA